MVMIGIDPHKRTHTAVAVDAHEVVLAERLVHARAGQVTELVAWADALGDRERIWAIESAGGLGYLLSQQLVAAGEYVVDIPATLASRVRVLSSGHSGKNDPNDARSVAIAALRAPVLVPVRAEDHRSVLRLLSRRHTQLSWTRNFTPRPKSFGATSGTDALQGDLPQCLNHPLAGSARYIAFYDHGRHINVIVAIGSTASPERRADVFEILNSFRAT
jgi:hypothetical protein